MGRPRKRRHLEEQAQLSSCTESETVGRHLNDSVRDDVTSTTTTSNPPTIITNATNLDTQDFIQPDLSLEPNLDFLSQFPDSSLPFLDLMPDYNTGTDDFIHPYVFNGLPSGQGLFESSPFPTVTMNGTDLIGSINFEDLDPSVASMSRDIGSSIQQSMATHKTSSPEPSDSNASYQATSIGTPDTQLSATETPNTKPMPTSPCGCLSTMYLALESLTHLPQDVATAMRTAQNACKIAHEVIKCPYCYNIPVDDIFKPPPIQSFQNLMCLGALIPSACNAYATILEMVDTEAEAAKKEGRVLWFSFKEMSGVWGEIIDENKTSCPIVRDYSNKFLHPDVWRISVRVILRLDVYGIEEEMHCPPDDGSPDPSPPPPLPRSVQCGLRDVITLVDARNRKRHELFDSLILAGKAPLHPQCVLFPGPHRIVPPEERNCVRILETARIALSNLVIS